ncbi:hypothetical protein, partial [Armatimonas sp.]|uniref:hypothetical protein n=1 Tax=Armatimonas sp. TaxID=1872638 RepID=UPI00375343BF
VTRSSVYYVENFYGAGGEPSRLTINAFAEDYRDFDVLDQDIIYCQYLSIISTISKYSGYGIPPYIRDFDNTYFKIKHKDKDPMYSVEFRGRDPQGNLQLISGLTAIL